MQNELRLGKTTKARFLDALRETCSSPRPLRFGMPAEGDETDVMGDVRAAEEDTGVREEGGQTIEPFSMDEERREGLVDEEGNFIKLKNREGVHEQDRWLQDERNKTDPSLAEKVREQNEALTANSERLPDSHLAQLKREAAQFLLQGETVMQALKRLRPQPKQVANRKPWQKKSKQPETTTSQGPTGGEQAKRADFDRLTELADALFHNGEYDAYSSDKRRLEREADVYGGPPQSSSQPGRPSVDMFADD